MQELVRLVINRTGLSHERATIVVRITLDFIKKQLPAPMALEIDIIMKNSRHALDPRSYFESLSKEQ